MGPAAPLSMRSASILSRHGLAALRAGKRDEPLNRFERQVGIIFVDFIQRRTKLGVLNDCIRENACAPHNGATRDLAGYPFHQFAPRPVDITIRVRHAVHPPFHFTATWSPIGMYCRV